MDDLLCKRTRKLAVKEPPSKLSRHRRPRLPERVQYRLLHARSWITGWEFLYAPPPPPPPPQDLLALSLAEPPAPPSPFPSPSPPPRPPPCPHSPLSASPWLLVALQEVPRASPSAMARLCVRVRFRFPSFPSRGGREVLMIQFDIK